MNDIATKSNKMFAAGLRLVKIYISTALVVWKLIGFYIAGYQGLLSNFTASHWSLAIGWGYVLGVVILLGHAFGKIKSKQYQGITSTFIFAGLGLLFLVLGIDFPSPTVNSVGPLILLGMNALMTFYSFRGLRYFKNRAFIYWFWGYSITLAGDIGVQFFGAGRVDHRWLRNLGQNSTWSVLNAEWLLELYWLSQIVSSVLIAAGMVLLVLQSGPKGCRPLSTDTAKNVTVGVLFMLIGLYPSVVYFRSPGFLTTCCVNTVMLRYAWSASRRPNGLCFALWAWACGLTLLLTVGSQFHRTGEYPPRESDRIILGLMVMGGLVAGLLWVVGLILALRQLPAEKLQDELNAKTIPIDSISSASTNGTLGRSRIAKRIVNLVTLGNAFSAALFCILLLFWFRGRHSEDPLTRALSSNDTNAVVRILKSNPSLVNKPLRFWGDTPLVYAVTFGKPKEIIDLLINNGADINARSGGFNLTPLQKTVWSGNVDAVKLLLAHKPDVNAVNPDHQTAFHYAIAVYMNAARRNDARQIMELLLANGANINLGTPILTAASHYGNNTDLMEFLLSKGANPNLQDSEGYTPLHYAVLFGSKDLVELILRYHPDVKLKEGYYGTPLATAVKKGRLDMALLIQDYILQSRSNTVGYAAARGNLDELRNLLQKDPQSVEEKDELGFTPLAWAAEAGQKDAAELLLSLGADPNTTDEVKLHPLEWAAFNGHLPLAELLVAKGVNNLSTALFLAIQQKQIPVAKFLLEHGADPNARYRPSNTPTALHTAAQQGDVAAARVLLEHGAQVNALDMNNDTPLQCAASKTSIEMVELLFKNGAIIPANAPGYWTIFHEWALGAGDPRIADALLSHKADVNAKNGDGQTPLHFASRQGQLQAVEWLLKHGAEVNAKDNNGRTSLGSLRGRQGRKERKDVADLLQKYGGKE